MKFTRDDLIGYGFDLDTDRVIRFTKFVDGVYLNTRATYSINKLSFTHYELRLAALNQIKVTTHNKIWNLNRRVFYWLIVLLIIIFMTASCDFNFSFTNELILE